MRAGGGLLVVSIAATPAVGGPAEVVNVSAKCAAPPVCQFTVTVKHADEGWDHYADRWEILTPDGEVIATRVLRHPHVKEQPFTRALPGVRVPEGLDRVRVRARDSRHGFQGAEFEVAIPTGATATVPGEGGG